MPRILILALIAFLLLQCNQRETTAGSEPPPIELKATVQPAQAMTITAQIDGQVRSIAVREGGPVSIGTELVALANPTIEREAAYARA